MCDLDLSSIRAIAARGDPVTAAQVLALCGRVEELEDRDRKSVIVIKNFLQLRNDAKEEVYRLRPLLACARAWAGAIGTKDAAAIAAAEQELLKAIREAS